MNDGASARKRTCQVASFDKDTEKQVLVTYRGDAYDVSSFLKLHPGGPNVITELEGKDITEAFNDVGHSKHARKLILKYKVGGTASLDCSEYTKDADYNEALGKVLSKRLFTAEDKLFIHKTLGLLSLLSFAYRYFYVLPTTGSLGFQHPSLFNMATLFLHMALSSSSLIFHVLEKRMKRNPLIIYEEYRLHAIIFTLRGTLVTLFGMYMHLLDPMTRAGALLLLIFTLHQVVDHVTRVYGTPGVTAVRNGEPNKFRNLKLFFAYYQMMAMASHITVDPMLCDLGWNGIVAVQSSAFLMTLKRKGLIKWTSHAFWYGIALLLSMGYMMHAKGSMIFVVVALVFYVRSTFNLNKYVVWPVYAACLYMTLDYFGRDPFLFRWNGLGVDHSHTGLLVFGNASNCSAA